MALTRFTFPSLITAAICASAALSAPAAEGSRTYTTTLTGTAEVPGPGDSDGSGSATVTVSVPTKEVCYELEVSGIAQATMAHIHLGAVGTAGGVVVTLEPPADGSSEGCVEVSGSVAAQILARPQLYYVNVHNADYLSGAVRGQLR